MVSSSSRQIGLASLFSIPAIVALTLVPAALAQETSQTPGSELEEEGTELQVPQTPGSQLEEEAIELQDPEDLRPLSQDTSLLSVEGGKRLMDEAQSAMEQQDYELATQKLQRSREVFNQLSNFHQQIASSFSGINNVIADDNRNKALEAAQMRDGATYELAVAHRAQNQPELSVPLLIQIIRSQQPTRELGSKAYRQLFELGFVDTAEIQKSEAQNSEAQEEETQAQETEDSRPLNQETILLSQEGGERLMVEARDSVGQQDYELATKKLQRSREIFNQLSNFHQQLASSFSGINNDIAEEQRNKALETAQMRDRATYELALVHRAKNEAELAVPLLIQIIRSQQPTRELGSKAYQQLFELGFADTPYSDAVNSTSFTP